MLRLEPDLATPPADPRPLRILLMPASYVPVLGGLQTATHAVAGHLRQFGHDIRVVTTRYPRILPASETINGVPVERWSLLTPRWSQLHKRRLDVFLAGLYHYPLVRARLDRLLHAFRPDVVNVHFPDPQIPFVLRARRRHPFRLVVSLHGHDVERYSDGTARTSRPEALRSILKAADAVTACSQHLLDQASRLEPAVVSKGTVIENGIDPSRFADPTTFPHPRPYVLGMGRLTRKKGFGLLIEAFAATGPAAEGVDLLLAGDGEEAAPLRSLAAQLGLNGRVRFLGRMSQGEIVQLLNGCRLLAVPSRAEPFGIVALEGLAAGKPVVATRVGGMGPFLTRVCEHIPTAQGLVRLVEPSVDGLKAGLRAALSAGVMATDETTAELIRKTYSWESVSRSYERTLTGSNESGCH